MNRPSKTHQAIVRMGQRAWSRILKANKYETAGESLRWAFPLIGTPCPGIPVEGHPGSFGVERRNRHHHTGVDLCEEAYGMRMSLVSAGQLLFRRDRLRAET